MKWDDPLPETTKQQGLVIPVYLDAESVYALGHDPGLCEKANWLVHIGKAVNTKAPSKETKSLTDLVNKLKLAKIAYDSLADCDKARIDEFAGSDNLQKMIDNATDCIEKPLPKKSKLENLYWTFSTTGSREWRKLSRADSPTEFQLFMAVVVRLVKSDSESFTENYIDQVTKAYQRIVLGQKV
jgi:hypothetical protein